MIGQPLLCCRSRRLQCSAQVTNPESRSPPLRAQVLKDLQENPKASQHHLRNPQIMAKIQKLVGAGIVRMS